MRPRNKVIGKCLALLLFGIIYSCNTDIENVEIQKPYTYDEQYYKNLREYKASEHSISYMWFADYSAAHSVGTRFLGLPDSLDICSLWSGIPTEENNPEAYKEMRFIQNVKGTKIVYCTFPRVSNQPDIMALPEEERVAAYGNQVLNTISKYGLDGIDMDYEMKADWLYGKRMVELLEYLGQYIGPKGKDPSKLLIVDVVGNNQLEGGYEYLSYLVSQSYGAGNAAALQEAYDKVSAYLPPERFVVTANMGDYHATGGVEFVDVTGNSTSAYGGPLYNLEGMSRWNPNEGKKGGFGAFYGQRDYNNEPPYKYFRRAIQQQNPAAK